jgi:outer membrane protein assembly factor BamB
VTTRSRFRVAVAVALAAVAATGALLGPRLLALVGHASDAAGDAPPDGHPVGLDRSWVAPVTGWPSALAADAKGSVVVAGAGEVRALGRRGATQWRIDVPGAALHAPALDGRTVLVGAGDRVAALERADGSRRWAIPVADRAAGPVAVAASLAIYGTERGTLGVVDARTGAPRWSATHPGAIRSAPVVDPGAGSVVGAWHGGSDAGLRALDLETGALRWEAPLERFASGPVVHRGLVVVGEGDGDGRARVVARRVADGQEAWSTAVPASFESGITPGADDGEIAVVDHFGGLTLLDARTGTVRHRIELEAPVLRTTVVLAADVAALTTYGGQLVVIDRRSGRVRHRLDPGGYPAAIARTGPDLLVALRIRGPGRVESLRLG